MSYRLDEGQGRCVYRVGVEDDGCHSLLSYKEVAESCRILEFIARSLNAVVVDRKMIQNEIKREPDGTLVLIEQDPLVVLEPSVLGDARGRPLETVEETKGDSLVDKAAAFTRAELTIQSVETHLLDPVPFNLNQSATDGANEGKYPIATSDNLSRDSLSVGETLSSRNIRVAVVGNVDAGKSTLIGSLTTSTLDDGRGKCRTSIMKHRHEIETGRTSTATTHLMGFRSTGEPIAGKDQVRISKRKGEDEIARESYRVITLMDLAGHEKYLKTTYVPIWRLLSETSSSRSTLSSNAALCRICSIDQHSRGFFWLRGLRSDPSEQPSATYSHDAASLEPVLQLRYSRYCHLHESGWLP
jgi:hypothetical protein